MNLSINCVTAFLFCLFGFSPAFAQDTKPKTDQKPKTEKKAEAKKDDKKKQPVAKPPKYDPGKTYAPSPVPDRIILTWSDDPTTTQSVTWRTDVSVAKAMAEIAVSTDGPKLKKLSQPEVTSTKLTANLGTAAYHSATFKNLTPETKYVFRVGDGTNWSEWSPFQTASKSAKPFSFIYFGDAQNNIKTHWSRVIREAFKDAPRAAFLLHCGDLVDQANNDELWGEWFYGGGWINRTMPSLATPGNHEYKNGKLSGHWRHLFTLPEHGPKGLEETVYYIDYQGARIISLNSTKDLDAQVKWFHEVMKTNKSRWTIVAMHHPIYSTARDRDNKNLRDKFKPLFDQYKIDIVLQGHDHSYGRTRLVDKDYVYEKPKKEDDKKKADDKKKEDDKKKADAKKETDKKKKTANKQVTRSQSSPSHAHDHSHPHDHVRNVMTGLKVHNKESGTMYVVSVSGPKQYKVQEDNVFRRLGQDKQLYQIITVDGDLLKFAAYTASGRLHDRFTLQKKDGQPNQLIEQVPVTIQEN